MDETPAQLFTNPTELDRHDGFIDLAVLAGAALGAWWLVLQGVPWPWLVPPLLVVAIWMLSGAPAADVPYLGALASGVQSKLGLRRIHEWVQVIIYFWLVAHWPVWRAWCVASFRSSRQRTIKCARQLSARMRCRLSRACSWASAIRYRLSVRLAR